MWKDIVFCIIIIVVIITLDFFIQDYIKNSAEEMTMKLDSLKQEVSNKEEDKINEVDTKEVRETWEEKYKILASVIEHDELEKVEKNKKIVPTIYVVNSFDASFEAYSDSVSTILTGIYSALENNELSEAISELDESIFILRHIKDKYSFKIENVF